MSRELLTRLINAVLSGGSGSQAATVSETALIGARGGQLSMWATSVTDTIDISSAASGYHLRIKILSFSFTTGASDYQIQLWNASSPLANFRFSNDQYVGLDLDSYYLKIDSGNSLRLSREEGQGLLAANVAWQIKENAAPE